MARNPDSITPKPCKQPRPVAELVDPAQNLPLRSSDSNSMTTNGHTQPTDISTKKVRIPAGARLANEVLDLILDQIEADPSKGVNVTRREYLSQESFRSLPFPSSESRSTRVQDLSNWRLVCRQFSEVGAVHQFARVTTRFSEREFKRLEWLASQRHLVQHVKKFSYMVPWFYVQGRDSVGDALPEVPESLAGLDSQVFSLRIRDQREIVESKKDLEALKKALSAFTGLQHIQILPVQDDKDRQLLAAMRAHTNLTQYVQLKWAPACSHSTKTIGEALLASQSPFKRFSSPMLSPQSAIVLADNSLTLAPGISETLGRLASRLTCLELHFDDGIDLDAKMKNLSPLFKTVFTAATSLEAVHVGFPSHRPLSLKLEDLFHNVRWDGLVAFGIQGWKLDGDEIMALAGRHRERLKGLRLRDVQLKQGSMWKEVLDFLRNNMRNLDWVSLRRIGYATTFDEFLTSIGGELPDDPPGGYSSSDTDSADEDPDDDLEDDRHDSDQESVRSVSTVSEDSDDEHGMAANGMDFPQLNGLPDTPTSGAWCNCGDSSTGPETAEDLGDNGVDVSQQKRKLWERWVVRRCPEHSLG